jgi:hypothetical protein
MLGLLADALPFGIGTGAAQSVDAVRFPDSRGGAPLAIDLHP